MVDHEKTEGKAHAAATLSCFYDFSVSPTGFDFATFLALAEMQRRRQGLDAFRVIVVPAENGGFWDQEPYDIAMKRARVENLLRPLAELMPACTGFHVCANRDAARDCVDAADGNVFPDRYTLDRPIADAYQWAHVMGALACGDKLPGWTVPAAAKEKIAAWIDKHVGGRKIVTVTLREASYSPRQNSNVAAWCEFAREIDRDIYCPVILRDTEQILKSPPPAFEGLLCCPEASLDVRVRAALYERAYANMLSANGPMQLLWLNPDATSMTFKLINFDEPRGCPLPIRSMGFDVGRPPAGLSPRHRVCWTDDDVDFIRAGFREMVARLDAGDRTAGISESAFVTARRLRTTGRDAARGVYIYLARSNTGATRAAAVAGIELTALQAPSAVPEPQPPEWPEWHAQFTQHHRLPAAQSWPDDPEATIELGEWYAVHKFPERSAAAFSHVLSLDSNHATAKHGLGQLALARKDFATAIPYLADAASAEPYLARSHDDYGDALMAIGKTSEARAQYEIAVRNDPSDRHARSRLALGGGTTSPTLTIALWVWRQMAAAIPPLRHVPPRTILRRLTSAGRPHRP